jgi:hypothetical protein
MSYYPLLLVQPLETWLLVTVVCTLLLWMDAVLLVAGGLVRRASWRLHARALIPLLVSLLPGMLVLHIFDTIDYWTQLEVGTVQSGPVPQDLVNNVAIAVSQVTLLGSIAVIVTGFVLALGLTRLWPSRVSQLQESR